MSVLISMASSYCTYLRAYCSRVDGAGGGGGDDGVDNDQDYQQTRRCMTVMQTLWQAQGPPFCTLCDSLMGVKVVIRTRRL